MVWKASSSYASMLLERHYFLRSTLQRLYVDPMLDNKIKTKQTHKFT